MIGGCGLCAKWLLKLTYGLLFIAAGADKFFNMLTPWSKFISPKVLAAVPVDVAILVSGIGIFEILLGLLILCICPRLGAFLAAVWLLVIAGNLFTMGYPYDIAVRDVVMAMGALALAFMSKPGECATCSCKAAIPNTKK